MSNAKQNMTSPLRPIVFCVLLIGAAAYFWLIGSVRVIDDSRDAVAAATLVGNGHEAPLHRLWPGLFYGIPTADGSVEIRCRNGRQFRGGYVSKGLHTTIRVEDQGICASDARKSAGY